MISDEPRKVGTGQIMKTVRLKLSKTLQNPPGTEVFPFLVCRTSPFPKSRCGQLLIREVGKWRNEGKAVKTEVPAQQGKENALIEKKKGSWRAIINKEFMAVHWQNPCQGSPD